MSDDEKLKLADSLMKEKYGEDKKLALLVSEKIK